MGQDEWRRQERKLLCMALLGLKNPFQNVPMFAILVLSFVGKELALLYTD